MDTGTRLAVDRTRLAYERTLMAWVRTAVTMITFGFTIYKFFQFELTNRPEVQGRVLGPRGFAIIMIGFGLLALVVSTIQHHQSIRTLRKDFRGVVPPSMATLLSSLIAIFGLIALAIVIWRG